MPLKSVQTLRAKRVLSTKEIHKYSSRQEMWKILGKMQFCKGYLLLCKKLIFYPQRNIYSIYFLWLLLHFLLYGINMYHIFTVHAKYKELHSSFSLALEKCP